MIIFKSIEYKNFLSTGNIPNKINLNSHKSTLCTGFTGHGKSTLIDAIIFVLFNKPFRNLSRKDKLINSINGKNCEVIIEFATNGKDYKVIRGLKPDKFEIYANNNLIIQESHSKDYQTLLEKQILQVNYKTFTQVVILGSLDYIPFMKLSASDRRSVIEDILDIKVFSTMNDLLKQKITITRDKYNTIVNELATIKNNAINQKKVIETIKSTKSEIINLFQEDITTNVNKIQELQEENNILNKEILSLQNNINNHDITLNVLSEVKSKKISTHTEIGSIKKDIHFFESNTKCPVCVQEITTNHKNSIVEHKTNQLNVHFYSLKEYEEKQQELEKQINANLNIIKEIQGKQNKISVNSNHISYLMNQNKKSLNSIEDHKKKESIDIISEEEKFKILVAKGKSLNTLKLSLEEEKNIHDIATLLLKDTGIKSKIITEYIPVINKYINKYINDLELYVKFELDDQFKETIKSRYRDKFEYASFSAGESQKLDLAILFTWRHIAKIKNSCNTNLLIMDEVLDGHLDNDSTSYLLEVFKQYSDINLFVISHSPGVYIDSFDNHLHIEKKNEFSVIV